MYLAAPFFKPEQVALVEQIEVAAAKPTIRLFSPRSEGVILGMTKEERDALAPKIFESNCSHIDRTDLVFAVVDDRDPGVIWEMGYAYARSIPIITYTDRDFGLNVMISMSVAAHVKGMAAADKLFAELSRMKDVHDFLWILEKRSAKAETAT